MLILIINAISSLKLTTALLALLGLVVGVVYHYQLSYSQWLIAPIALLSLNLLAAIIANGRFRRQLPLLLFHVSLLVFILLLLISRLTYLDGRISLSEGQIFNGQLDAFEAGDWHSYDLANQQFKNLAVEFEMTPLVAITSVKSRVEINGHEQVVGEHLPLLINNYRFYITRNIGFSAQIVWRPHRQLHGQLGSVHFPPYLGNTFNQTASWTPPQSATELWLMLEPNQEMLKDNVPMRLTPPQNHKLIIRVNETRHSLSPGQQLVTSDGVLTYQGLRSWMGYKVHYDPTKPWLFASLFIAIGAMAWFFYGKFSQRSWQAKSATPDPLS